MTLLKPLLRTFKTDSNQAEHGYPALRLSPCHPHQLKFAEKEFSIVRTAERNPRYSSASQWEQNCLRLEPIVGDTSEQIVPNLENDSDTNSGEGTGYGELVGTDTLWNVHQPLQIINWVWKAYRFSALCYKPQGRGFETRWGHWFFSIYLILPAALDPGVYSASNRNQKWIPEAEKLCCWGVEPRPVRRAINITAICEPTV
jgi:hypothetical protein